jgi:hypothetical protein
MVAITTPGDKNSLYVPADRRGKCLSRSPYEIINHIPNQIGKRVNLLVQGGSFHRTLIHPMSACPTYGNGFLNQ